MEDYDIQDVDLSNVDTGYPVLAPGVHKVALDKIDPLKRSKKGNGANVLAHLTLVDDAPRHESEEMVNAGFKVTYNIYIPDEGTDGERFRRYKAFFEAVNGGALQGSVGDYEQYYGNELLISTDVQPDQNGSPSTNVRRVFSE